MVAFRSGRTDAAAQNRKTKRSEGFCHSEGSADPNFSVGVTSTLVPTGTGRESEFHQLQKCSFSICHLCRRCVLINLFVLFVRFMEIQNLDPDTKEEKKRNVDGAVQTRTFQYS